MGIPLNRVVKYDKTRLKRNLKGTIRAEIYLRCFWPGKRLHNSVELAFV